MELYLESGYTSLNKAGEELCGDRVKVADDGEYTTLVLADGLGSGVKANILSTLTSTILCTMVSGGVSIEECVDTIIQTLPVCKERGVAYATFTVIHVNREGKGYMFEFDNPEAIYITGGKCRDFERVPHKYEGKTVYITELDLKPNDYIVTMSDGVIHSCIGMILNFVWLSKDVIGYLDKTVKPYMSAGAVACLLASACNDLYLDKPGDDTTVAAVRIREAVHVNIMVGPPVDKTKDDFYIARFLEGDSKKIVCGGTSSTIVARYLGTQVKADFDFPDKDVPPIGHIDGIDLTTEGVLTLRKLVELSEKYLSHSDLTPKSFVGKRDGASMLAEMLFEEATHVKFFVGQSINAAHQGLPIDITMKLKLVDTISDHLRRAGKQVEVYYD